MKSKVLFGLLVFLILIFISFYLFHNTNPFSKFKDAQSYSYNNYEQAVSLAIIDVNKALNLCSKTNEMKDECLTNIARIIGEKDYEKGLEICEEITEPRWKGECFFIIAELVLFNKNVSLASDLCEKSEIFKGECYGHLWMFIPDVYNLSSAILACNAIPTNLMYGCFWNFGYGIVRRYDIDSAISACEEVSNEFRNDCFTGLSEGIAFHFGGDINSIILKCNKLPIKFKTGCFKSFGRNIGQHFKDDANSAISICEKIPAKFRNDCFNGLDEAAISKDEV